MTMAQGRLNLISRKVAEFVSEKAASPSVAHFLLVGLGISILEAVREGALKVGQFGQFGPLIAIAFILVIALYLIIRINQRLDRMEPQIGVKTRLMTAEETYKEAEKAVRNAKEEILATTNWAQPFQSNPDASADMKSYFPALLQKVTEQEVRYERIIQMPPADKKVVQRTMQMIDHIRECIAKRNDKTIKGIIGVFRCDESISVNFLLVDGKHLFFQIDEFDESTKCFQFSKCLSVRDDRKELTAVFKRLFESLKQHGFRTMEDQEVQRVLPEETKSATQ
jgi:hypothetical protein